MTSTLESPAPVAPPTDDVRLLGGLRLDGRPVGLDDHVRRYGTPPFRGRRRRLTRSRGDQQGLIDVVERAGLLGRGGAGFPTARKLRAVVAERGSAVVVANGTEGEPLSRKDQLLLQQLPHLVLDGASLAAEAVGATRVIVSAHPAAVEAVQAAAAERAARRFDPIAIEVVPAPASFVAGEETAVVNWIDNAVGLPTGRSTRPFERGVQRRPTLVNNVETLAQLALVARYGDAWYRSVGTPADPGTSLVTLSGAVGRPGVYEIARGSTLADLVERAGGATEPLQAALVGGFHGVYVPTDALADLRLGVEGLAPHGGSIGAGIVALLGVSECGLQSAAAIARYLANESAGQCGPCANGLPAIAGALEQLALHAGPPPANLLRWMDDVEGRGACRHPDGTTKMIRTALRVFSAEVTRHGSGSCRSGHRLAPPVPAPRSRRRPTALRRPSVRTR